MIGVSSAWGQGSKLYSTCLNVSIRGRWKSDEFPRIVTETGDCFHSTMPEAKEVRETEQEKQCRICFDGEDESLGKLIRPCLCRGSISVSHFLEFTFGTLTSSDEYSVRPCSLLEEVEEHFFRQQLFLSLSAMSLPLPFCSHQSDWVGDQSE